MYYTETREEISLPELVTIQNALNPAEWSPAHQKALRALRARLRRRGVPIRRERPTGGIEGRTREHFDERLDTFVNPSTRGVEIVRIDDLRRLAPGEYGCLVRDSASMREDLRDDLEEMIRRYEANQAALVDALERVTRRIARTEILVARLIHESSGRV